MIYNKKSINIFEAGTQLQWHSNEQLFIFSSRSGASFHHVARTTESAASSHFSLFQRSRTYFRGMQRLNEVLIIQRLRRQPLSILPELGGWRNEAVSSQNE